MTQDLLIPGERYGLNGGGWPPLSIVRDMDGRYYEERLSRDLKGLQRREITEQEASDWIEGEECS